MKRLVYQPKVTCMIMRDSALKGRAPKDIGKLDEFLIDVTDDIVNGSVNRRLNAMSDITLTLQNKNGRYTRNNIIQPMDRIILRMCRVGTPFLVFSGFVDDAPYYQLYPGTVTISASDTLKLLHNTYFDPGLLYMQSWFVAHGWSYDAATGALTKLGVSTPSAGIGNDDLGGHMGDLIFAMLTEIAQWPDESISIYNLPPKFIKSISVLFQDVTDDSEAAYNETVRLLDKLYGGLGSSLLPPGTVTGSDGSSTPGTPNPQTGNTTDMAIAEVAHNAGFIGEALIIAVAIALAESGGISYNMNYNSNGTYDVGLWQINTVHTSGGGSGLPAPPGGDFHNLPADWLAVKPNVPFTVAAYIENCFDPDFNAAQAFAISSHGTSFTPWVTYTTGAYKSGDNLSRAEAAVKALLGGNTPSTPKPTTKTRTALWKNKQVYWKDTMKPYAGESDWESPLAIWSADHPGQDFPKEGETWEVPSTASGSTTDTDPVDNRDPLDQTIVDKVISIAKSQVGVRETGGENRGPEVEQYLAYTGNAPGQPWCAAFVQWIFAQAGRPLTETGLSASVEGIHGAAQTQGWIASSPQPGDIVLWDRPGHESDHTGIVVGVNGDQIYTVEGNSGDGVANRGPKPASTPDESGTVPTFVRVPKIGTSTANYVGIDPTAPVNADTLGSGSASSLTVQQIAALGAQAAFYVQQFQASDAVLSQSLSGQRALSNDQPIIEWIEQAVTSSGRAYCSMPNGKFLAFFPDRWGFFDRTPYWFINDIEITDLTINKNDTNLVTHVFTAGPNVPDAGITLQNRMQSMIASVEDKGFRYFVHGNDERVPQLDPVDFLARYGARPYVNDLPNINNPLLLWMHGWMKFLEFWSKRYTASATFTFMPELFPGGLVSFGNRIQMFLESVTHSFDIAGGFTTTAELSSIRGLTVDADTPDPMFSTAGD